MDNKEIADKLRDMVYTEDLNHMRRGIEKLIDTLDPSKPEPGTLAWAVLDTEQQWSPRIFFSTIEAHEWGKTRFEGKYEVYTVSIPARILAPDEVAVKVPPIDEWPSGVYAMCWQWQVPPVGRTRVIITRAEAEEMQDD